MEKHSRQGDSSKADRAPKGADNASMGDAVRVLALERRNLRGVKAISAAIPAITYPTWVRLLNNTTLFDYPQMRQIAAALGIDVRDLTEKAEAIAAGRAVTAQETEPDAASRDVASTPVTPMVPDRRRKGKTRAELDKLLTLADQMGEDPSTRSQNH